MTREIPLQVIDAECLLINTGLAQRVETFIVFHELTQLALGDTLTAVASDICLDCPARFMCSPKAQNDIVKINGILQY